jgi:HEAT repeat protein
MRLTALTIAICLCAAQEPDSADPKQRAKIARELGKGGSENIPQLTPLLKDPVADVRIEAVRAIAAIGTQHSLDPLVTAARDNEPEIQLRVTDGLVNFYVPGYVQSGLSRLSSNIRSRFDKENTQVIDPYVTVRPEVISALAGLARGGGSMEVRANAARAIGILRGRAAVPALLEAIQTKDDNVIFESLIALQKIGDPSAGPRIVFLARDLHERVQIAAIDTMGLLKAKEAVPNLQSVFDSSSSDRVRSAALSSLAMLADPGSRPYFQRAFNDKNEQVRAAAAEGFARLQTPSDRPMIEKEFNDERKMAPRLAQAFALVSLGHRGTEELAPLTYLVNTLNSKSYRNVAEPYLVELARDTGIRGLLHGYLGNGTREEKSGLLRVLAASGDRTSVAAVEPFMKDPDAEVAQEAIRTVRTLQARTR